MKAALFDLDGVLVDTEPSYGIFWGGIGRKYGVGDTDFAQIIKGSTLTRILDTYIPKELQPVVVKELADYETTMEYPLFEGAERLLSELRNAAIPCAIVTSSNNDKMNNLWLQHPELRSYFDAVITDENVTKSKPDPEPYIIAAKELGLDASQCWVFEDSINGLISGRRAGAKVIAIATTNPKEALIDKADAVFENIADIDLSKLG